MGGTPEVVYPDSNPRGTTNKESPVQTRKTPADSGEEVPTPAPAQGPEGSRQGRRTAPQGPAAPRTIRPETDQPLEPGEELPDAAYDQERRPRLRALGNPLRNAGAMEKQVEWRRDDGPESRGRNVPAVYDQRDYSAE
jgi:hypothetical protein